MTVCTIAVAGLGLIGGSLYKAAEAAGFAVRGLHHGDGPEKTAAALAEADLVFVALPPAHCAPWIAAHAAQFKQGAAVVDVCGVKTPVVAAVAQIPKNGWTFVGGHPMAGKEKGGWENATADLFKGASMILTPDAATPPDVLAALEGVFPRLGFARVVRATPQRHDALIGFTSQLGHVIACCYVQDELVEHAVGFSAGSYANMTRIATMEPDAWADLFLANRAGLLAALDRFRGRLETFRAVLDAADRPALEALIAAGADAKRHELSRR